METGQKQFRPRQESANTIRPLESLAPLDLDLQRSVPVLVTLVANRINALGLTMFGRGHRLGPTTWNVLVALAAHPDSSGSQISHLIGLDPGSVSRALKALVKRGLVRITSSENMSRFALTADGRELHDEALQTVLERERIILEAFSREESELLLSLLQRLLVGSHRQTKKLHSPVRRAQYRCASTYPK